jgi:hypothetical protein
VTGENAGPVRQAVEGIYRSDSRRILATLIRLLGGDFELHTLQRPRIDTAKSSVLRLTFAWSGGLWASAVPG